MSATQSLVDGQANAVRYEDEPGKLPADQELPPSVEKAAPSPLPCPPTTTQTEGAGHEAAWGLETGGGAELGLQVVPPSVVYAAPESPSTTQSSGDPQATAWGSVTETRSGLDQESPPLDVTARDELASVRAFATFMPIHSSAVEQARR
jgi:hypothetical protein